MTDVHRCWQCGEVIVRRPGSEYWWHELTGEPVGEYGMKIRHYSLERPGGKAA